MVKTGTVWRVEIVSSTLISSDDIKDALYRVLGDHPEIDDFEMEELYEAVKLLRDDP